MLDDLSLRVLQGGAVNPLSGSADEAALTINHLAKQVAEHKAEAERLRIEKAAALAIANAAKGGPAVVSNVGVKGQLRAEAAAAQAVQAALGGGQGAARAQFAPSAT